MLISAIKKLLHQTSTKSSLAPRKSLAETSAPPEAQDKEEKKVNEEKLITSEEIMDSEVEEDIEKSDLSEPSEAPRPETKAHLTSSVPRAAGVPAGVMTRHEMQEARAIFGDLDDKEIHRLYKKVTQ